MKKLMLGFFLALSFNGFAQIVSQQLVWLGATAQYQFANGYTAGVELEERRYVFPDRRQQRVLPNVFVKKKFSSRWDIAAGLWFFTISQPSDPEAAVAVDQKEFRPYASVGYNLPAGKGSFRLQLKSEYRQFPVGDADHHFDGKGATWSLRERFKVKYTYPLGKRFSLSFSEELHLNIAAQNTFKSFDQNRLRAGLSFQTGTATQLSAGYIYWLQPTDNAGEYFGRHILSLGVKYTFGKS